MGAIELLVAALFGAGATIVLKGYQVKKASNDTDRAALLESVEESRPRLYDQALASLIRIRSVIRSVISLEAPPLPAEIKPGVIYSLEELRRLLGWRELLRRRLLRLLRLCGFAKRSRRDPQGRRQPGDKRPVPHQEHQPPKNRDLSESRSEVSERDTRAPFL